MGLGANPMKHAGHMVIVLLALLVVAACGEGNGGAACVPEDVERCQCDDGRSGYQVCDPEGGSGYGACRCDLDASPYLPEAGLDDAGSGDANDGGSCGTMPLAFMCPCVSSSQCASGLCGTFPAKGNKCTVPCKSPSDCPAPSPGCNMMGLCKSP
jgi:hypothetical protein